MGQSSQIQETIKTFALGGFLTASTLIIGVNFKIFTNIFGERAKKYWWLFLITALIPICLVLFLFTFFFK